MGIKNLGRITGLSAYEIWLNAGNTGTEQDFLDSLQGSDYILTAEDKKEIEQAIEVNIPTKNSQLENDKNYATESFVTNKIAEAELSGSEVDLSGLATKDELNAKVDKVTGKSLIADTEIERLKTVTNYDDTELKNQINGKASITDMTNYIAEHKEELKGDKGDTGAAGNDYILTDEDKQEIAEKVKVNNLDVELYGLPILYLNGDTTGMNKDDAVTLNYKYEELEGTCSVKWQGSSSLTWAKKNYTIKFDNAFEAKEGWGEQKKYCFKANYIDFSHARNVVSAKIWGQIVKSRENPKEILTTLPNGGAIDGFPCTIVLNGEFWGVYTWNIPKDGWMLGMTESATGKEAIWCADHHGDDELGYATHFSNVATGAGDFELEFVSNEDDAGWALTSLNQAIQAVLDSNGTDIDTTVNNYIDINTAIDYYIFCVVLNGVDMGTKNYLLHTHDGVKWYFTGYDMDTTFGLDWDGKRFIGEPYYSFEHYSKMHKLMQLIYNYKKIDLKARYKELRSTILTESNLYMLFTNFCGEFPITLLHEDAKKWGIPNTSVNNVAQILNFFNMRIKKADEEMGLVNNSGTGGDSGDSGASYTNVLPTSQAFDSDEVFGGTGYMNNKAYVEGSIHDMAGYVQTGLFSFVVPASAPHPAIFVKGSAGPDDTVNTRVQLFKDGKTYVSEIYGTEAAGLNNYFTIEKLADDYYKFAPVVGDNGASNIHRDMGAGIIYASMLLKGTGDNLIITIDEPIE